MPASNIHTLCDSILDNSESSEQTVHCHNVQTNCYNLTSVQNISIFKLMTNVFDVEHHFDVALIPCACVCRYTPPPLPPSTFFHCLFILNQRELLAFIRNPYTTFSHTECNQFSGELLSLFNIQQRVLFSECTRINACSYCLSTLRLRSAYITQCDCYANGCAAFANTIITSESTRCIYFDVQYEIQHKTM